MKRIISVITAVLVTLNTILPIWAETYSEDIYPAYQEYTVSITAENASVMIERDRYIPGETVSFSVLPDSGKKISDVKTVSANECTLTEIMDDVYSFVMPENDVFFYVYTEDETGSFFLLDGRYIWNGNREGINKQAEAYFDSDVIDYLFYEEPLFFSSSEYPYMTDLKYGSQDTGMTKGESLYSVPDGIYSSISGTSVIIADGAVVSGPVVIMYEDCTKSYYADPSGRLMSGWLCLSTLNLVGFNDEDIYEYYDPETKERVSGFVEIDGIQHYFDENGHLLIDKTAMYDGLTIVSGPDGVAQVSGQAEDASDPIVNPSETNQEPQDGTSVKIGNTDEVSSDPVTAETDTTSVQIGNTELQADVNTFSTPEDGETSIKIGSAEQNPDEYEDSFYSDESDEPIENLPDVNPSIINVEPYTVVLGDDTFDPETNFEGIEGFIQDGMYLVLILSDVDVNTVGEYTAEYSLEGAETETRIIRPVNVVEEDDEYHVYGACDDSLNVYFEKESFEPGDTVQVHIESTQGFVIDEVTVVEAEIKEGEDAEIQAENGNEIETEVVKTDAGMGYGDEEQPGFEVIEFRMPKNDAVVIARSAMLSKAPISLRAHTAGSNYLRTATFFEKQNATADGGPGDTSITDGFHGNKLYKNGYYYRNGIIKNPADGEYYSFDSSGNMMTNAWVCTPSSSSPQEGWQRRSNEKQYFYAGNNGKLLRGYNMVDGIGHYFGQLDGSGRPYMRNLLGLVLYNTSLHYVYMITRYGICEPVKLINNGYRVLSKQTLSSPSTISADGYAESLVTDTEDNRNYTKLTSDDYYFNNSTLLMPLGESQVNPTITRDQPNGNSQYNLDKTNGFLARYNSVVEIRDPYNDKIPGTYNFAPKVVDGITTTRLFQPSGVQWTALNGTQSYIPVVDGSLKGKVGIIYEHVGMYNGRDMDVKMTITDYEFHEFLGDTEVGLLFVFKNGISITTNNLKSVTCRLDFIDHETQALTQCEGFMNIRDIDLNAGVQMGMEFDHLFVTPDSPILTIPGMTRGFTAPFQAGSDGQTIGNRDNAYWVMGTYKNADHVTLKVLDKNYAYEYAHSQLMPVSGMEMWTDDFTGNINDYYLAGHINGTPAVSAQIQSISFEPVVPFDMQPLNKTVSDTDEKNVTYDTLSSVNEPFTYTLTKYVPYALHGDYGNYKDFDLRFQSFSITDTIDSRLEFASAASDIKMVRYDGTVITGATASINGQTLTVTVSPETLAQDSFYDQTYMISFTVKIKNPSSYVDAQTLTFKNKGTLRVRRSNIDEEPVDSNEVTTVVSIDEKKGNLSITKKDSETGSVITSATNAVFKVTQWNLTTSRYEDTLASSTLTYSNGKYVLNNIPITAQNQGKFHVEETQSPTGYTGHYSADFTLTNNQTVELTANNTPEDKLGNLVITKTDSETGSAITTATNAIFKVMQWNSSTNRYEDTLATSVLTYSSGVYILNNIPITNQNQGKFHVEETQPPTGYTGHYSADFTLAKDETKRITVSNPPEDKFGNLSIIKKDSETGAVITTATNAVFKVTQWNSAASRYEDTLSPSTLTYSSGKYVLNNIPITTANQGKFHVEETQPPTGYTGSYSADFTLSKDENKVIEVTNSPEEKYGTISVVKKDAATGSVISTATNAEFKVTEWNSSSNRYEDTLSPGTMTYGSGKYTLSNIRITRQNGGKFHIKETKNPTGFTGTFESDVTLTESNSYIVSAEALNWPVTSPGPIVKDVTDTDEKHKTSNTLSATDEPFSYMLSYAVPQEYKTSSNGSGVNTYYSVFRLSDVIDERLVPDLGSVRVRTGGSTPEEGSDVTSSFTVSQNGQSVIIEAKQAPLNSSAFYGKTYNFFIPVKVRDYRGLDRSSRKDFPNTGQLTISRADSSVPISPDSTTSTVTLTSNMVHTYLSFPVVTVTKVDSEDPSVKLEGAVFEIRPKTGGSDSRETFAATGNLWPEAITLTYDSAAKVYRSGPLSIAYASLNDAKTAAVYNIVEVRAPVYYEKAEDIRAEVDLSSGVEFKTIPDPPTKYYMEINIVKKDIDTGEVISATDAEFKVTEYNKDTGVYEDTLGNNNKLVFRNGKYVSPKLLMTKRNMGKFKVEEIKAPTGYTGTWSKEYSFTKAEASGQPDNTVIRNDTAANTPKVPPVGKIIIRKRILEEDINWANGDPIFQFVVEGTDIHGKHIRMSDYVRFSQGNYSVVSGYAYLSIEFDNVPFGTYDLKELKSLRYYLKEAVGDTVNAVPVSVSQPDYGKDPSDIQYVTAKLDLAHREAQVTFTNEVGRFDFFTHTDIVKNDIPIKYTD